MNSQARRDIRRKLKFVNYAKNIGNETKASLKFGKSGEIFYQWKRA